MSELDRTSQVIGAYCDRVKQQTGFMPSAVLGYVLMILPSLSVLSQSATDGIAVLLF